MGILFYQIAIFIAIQISAFYSKKSRNTSLILIAIFTILQVYTFPLVILQFLTLYFSYWFSEKLFFLDSSVISTSKVNKQNFHNDFLNGIDLHNYERFDSCFISQINEEFEKKKFRKVINLIENLSTQIILHRNDFSLIEIFDLYVKYSISFAFSKKENSSFENIRNGYFRHTNRNLEKYDELVEDIVNSFRQNKEIDFATIEKLNFEEFKVVLLNIRVFLEFEEATEMVNMFEEIDEHFKEKKILYFEYKEYKMTEIKELIKNW